MKTILSLFIVVFIVPAAYSDTKIPAEQNAPDKQTIPVVPVDDTQALDSYRNYQIILPTVNPLDIAGGLILVKDHNESLYFPLLSSEEKKNYKPTKLSTTPYSAMLSEEGTAKVNFLLQPLGITLGPSSANKKLLQVNINELWQLEGPNINDIISNESTKKRLFEFGRIYRKAGYNVKYCNFVKYTLLTESVFESTNKEISASFIYIDFSGKKYRQVTALMQKELISTTMLDINPLFDDEGKSTEITKGGPTTASIPSIKKFAVSISKEPLALKEMDVKQYNAPPPLK